MRLRGSAGDAGRVIASVYGNSSRTEWTDNHCGTCTCDDVHIVIEYDPPYPRFEAFTVEWDRVDLHWDLPWTPLEHRTGRLQGRRPGPAHRDYHRRRVDPRWAQGMRDGRSCR